MYTGSFVNDVREGQGTYTWANGDSYTGSFSKNKLNGEGTYTWALAEGETEARVYTGYFKDGLITLTP